MLAKSVPISDCVYYWWFEYLKRSARYQKACSQNGRGMKKLYNDFGNIFEYKFWDWWKERGADLFAERRPVEIDDFLTVDDVENRREEFESGHSVLIAVPTTMKRTAIKRQVSALLNQLELSDYKSQAKYPLRNTKVDAASLGKCLAAYDMHVEGCSNVEIGGYFDYTKTELEELSEDARRRYIYTQDTEMQKRYQRKSRAREKLIAEARQKIEARLKKRGKEYPDSHEVDRLVDIELGLLTRKNESRRKTKNYLNVSASRMLKKAKANIAAVERGEFGVGH